MGLGLQRAPVTTRLSSNRAPMLLRQLMPAERARHAYCETRRSTATAQTTLNRRNNPIPQILQQCLGHPCWPPSPEPILNQNSRANAILANPVAVKNSLSAFNANGWSAILVLCQPD